MMDSPITCPLCSKPGFSDVDSLSLSLIRASTRPLACPICQEVLVGLDKLTIHLVSHSLHGHLLRASLVSNFTSSPLTLAKVQTLGDSQAAGGMSTLEPADKLAPSNVEVSSPIASYVLINFPTSETSGNQQLQIVRDAPLHTMIESSNEEVHCNNKGKSSMSSEELDFSSLLLSTSTGGTFSSNPTPIVLPQDDVCTEATDSGKPKHSLHSLFQDQKASSEMSLSDADEKMGVKNFLTSNNLPALDEGSISNGYPRHREKNKLPRDFVDCSPSNKSQVHPVPTKTELSTPGFDDNIASNTQNASASCGICGLTFSDTNIALLHQQLVHCQNYLNSSQTNHNKNSSSNQWQMKSSFSGHNREGGTSPHRFPCHICNKVFRMRGSLMVHLHVAHSLGEKTLQSNCPPSSLKQQSLCPENMAVELPQGLRPPADREASGPSSEHACISGFAESKANDETELNLSSSDTVSQKATLTAVPEEMCHVAEGKSANNSGLMETHPPISSSLSPIQSSVTQSGPVESQALVFPCSICSKTYSKEVLLTQHLKSHDSKQWECDVCFKTFTTKYFLKKHKRLHTGEMPYTCGICNKSFTFQQSYHKHLLYHSDEKPHSCSECGRAFKELSTLHNHQRIHTGEKPWACETCGKCFRQRVSYLVHRRIHTGAMPYQCTACQKSFRYKVSQRTHKCIVQPAPSTQSNEFLQHMLPTPIQEVNSTGAAPSLTSFLPPGEPHLILKERLLHFNMKQENHQFSDLNKLLEGNKAGSNNFAKRDPGNSQNKPTVCNRIENNMSFVQPKSFDLGCNPTQLGACSGFLKHLSERSDQPSSAVPSSCTEAGSMSRCKSYPHHAPNKLPPSSLAPDANESSSHVPLHIAQATSSSVDYNIDLLQDILSMVMSPSSESVTSPSSQMRQLSISAGAQNDDDLEAGLDLQQLLYGSCDSENAS